MTRQGLFKFDPSRPILFWPVKPCLSLISWDNNQIILFWVREPHGDFLVLNRHNSSWMHRVLLWGSAVVMVVCPMTLVRRAASARPNYSCSAVHLLLTILPLLLFLLLFFFVCVLFRRKRHRKMQLRVSRERGRDLRRPHGHDVVRHGRRRLKGRRTASTSV